VLIDGLHISVQTNTYLSMLLVMIRCDMLIFNVQSNRDRFGLDLLHEIETES